MKHRTIGLVAFLVLALTLVGSDRRYAYTAGHSAAGTSYKATVQMPTGTATVARGLVAVISCPTVTCTYQILTGGTAATATAVDFQRTRTETPAVAAGKFYGSSDSTGGTALWPATPLPVGTSTIALEDVEARPNERFHILVASGSSQTVTVNVKIEEFSDR